MSTFSDGVGGTRHNNIPNLSNTDHTPFELTPSLPGSLASSLSVIPGSLPPSSRDNDRFRINKTGAPTHLGHAHPTHTHPPQISQISQKISHSAFPASLSHVRRQCAETITSQQQENRISIQERFSERTYGGMGPPNMVAPSPDYYPHTGSMLGPYEASSSQYRGAKREDPNQGYPVSLPSLGISEESLILMSTRELNKFLKSKGISREDIK